MKRYKVVGSSKHEFMDIEMNIVFDDISLGKTCEVFGYTFTITQTGKVLVLANPDWVLTIEELPPPPKVWDHMISNPRDLRINHEVDVFLTPKHIKLTTTDRLKENHGVSLLCLYRFLQHEWKFIGQTTGTAFPFEYDPEYKLFTMRDEWNFDSLDSIVLIREGSFSRYNSEGRCI